MALGMIYEVFLTLHVTVLLDLKKDTEVMAGAALPSRREVNRRGGSCREETARNLERREDLKSKVTNE